MVNQSLHVLLHRRPRGRHDLIVLNLYRPWRHLVQTLMNNAQRLSKLLHSAQVPIIAVAVDPNRDVKFDLVVGIVGLGLSHVPGDT